MLVDVLDRRVRGDLLASDDQRTPAKLLSAVNLHREAHRHIRVEHRHHDRRRRIDDREHRRSDDIGIPRATRGPHIEVHGIGLTHHERILANLLAPHRLEAPVKGPP
jgi:hypothetical protein